MVRGVRPALCGLRGDRRAASYATASRCTQHPNRHRTTALAAALAANAVPATISAAIVIDGYTGWCPLCHDVSPCQPLVPEVTVSWLELLGCILTLRENLPFLATDPQLLGCILTLRENLPFLATDPQLLGCILTLRENLPFLVDFPRMVGRIVLRGSGVPIFLGWSAELCYMGPRYLFLGWSAELCYTGPRYLLLGWSAELCYTGPRYLFLGWSTELCYTGDGSEVPFLGWSAELSYTGPRSLFLGWSASA